jgi:LmbE family N-acetylglucosaminyl deacetylase
MKVSPLATAVPWDDLERVVILSPHLDDAALSCAGLLDFLSTRQAGALVISIYCGNPPAVKSSDGTLRTPQRKGHVNPRLRRLEDRAAMHASNTDFAHLSFPDNIYRRSPTTDQFIYRHARERWSAPRVDDMGHVEELYLVLRRLSLNLGRMLLISPMGIGQHVDHTIVARVALRLAEQGASLLFYEDFPYVVNPTIGSGMNDDPRQALLRLDRAPSACLALPVNVDAKAALIGHYSTQIPALFQDEAGLHQALQVRQHEGQPSEFYWKTRELRPTRKEHR